MGIVGEEDRQQRVSFFGYQENHDGEDDRFEKRFGEMEDEEEDCLGSHRVTRPRIASGYRVSIAEAPRHRTRLVTECQKPLEEAGLGKPAAAPHGVIPTRPVLRAIVSQNVKGLHQIPQDGGAQPIA